METILGVKGKDFVMLAADSTHPHSIMVLKDGKNQKTNQTNLKFQKKPKK